MRRCNAQLGGPWVTASLASSLVAYLVGQDWVKAERGASWLELLVDFEVHTGGRVASRHDSVGAILRAFKKHLAGTLKAHFHPK
eukprot:3014288-Alexandrium_andersonii.AAC.1